MSNNYAEPLIEEEGEEEGREPFRFEILSPEMGQRVEQMYADGEIPESKRGIIRDALDEYRNKVARGETGLQSSRQLVTNALETAFQIPREGGDEATRQLYSITKGTGRLVWDSLLFASDVAEFLIPDGIGTAPLDEAIMKAKEMARHRRELFLADMDHFIARDTEGDEASFVGDMIGYGGPMMYLPYNYGGWFKTIMANGMIGGTAAAAMDSEAKDLLDRVGEAKVGALWGAGFSAALTAPSAFRAWGNRRFLDGMETELARKNMALERELQNMGVEEDVIQQWTKKSPWAFWRNYRSGEARSKFNFSLPQLTADPFLTGLSYSSAHTMARNIQNGKIKGLIDFISKRATSLSEKGHAAQIATDLRGVILKVSDEIKDGAARQYGHSMKRLIDQAGDDVAVSKLEARDYYHKLTEYAADMESGRRLGHPAAVPKGVREHIEFIDKRLNPYKAIRVKENGKYVWLVRERATGRLVEKFRGRGNERTAKTRVKAMNIDEGKITVEDTKEMLEAHTNLVGGKATVFETASPGSDRNLGLMLKSALISAMRGNDRKSSKIVLDIRDQYRNEMSKLISLRRNLLGQIFEDADGYVTADDAVMQLLKRSPEEMRATREILEVWAPELVDDMKGYALRRIVDQSVDNTMPSSLFPVRPSKLIQELTNPTTNELGGLMKGFLTAAETRELQTVGKALRTLNETYTPHFSFASLTESGNLAINIVSRSPEFMARYLGRVFGQSDYIVRTLNDPQARHALITIAEKGTSGPSGRAAIAYLVFQDGQFEAEKQMNREMQQREEALQRVRRTSDTRLNYDRK